MLVLASGSPQRRAILEQLGIEFRAVVPEVEELAQGDPRDLVVENARRKARSVEGELVLGADTAVALDGRVYGKPTDEDQARSFLERLAGRSHEVHGGICLRDGDAERTAHAVTAVAFRALDVSDIDCYLASGEWRERAGAYAIQGRGAALVEAVDGDYLNVVGLAVSTLVALAPDLVSAAAASPGTGPPGGYRSP